MVVDFRSPQLLAILRRYVKSNIYKKDEIDMETPIISLDLETSGLIQGKHVPLSIGAVKVGLDPSKVDEYNSFYVQLEWDSFNCSPAAMKVNGLDLVNTPGPNGEFYNRSLPARKGLQAFRDWTGTGPWIALGKNVGSFDLPMLKSVCDSSWQFSYRSIDLNTLFNTISILNDDDNVKIMKDTIKASALDMQKSLFIKSGITSLAGREHHALTDAWWNVFAWKESLKWLGDM